MAGGTFKLSQPKVRPGTYVNVKNGRQPTASGTTRGTAVIPLIGYDWVREESGSFFHLNPQMDILQNLEGVFMTTAILP